MDALPNANSVEQPSGGFTPIAFPEAKSSQTGVSVEYVPDATGQKRWYVFRASYTHDQNVMRLDGQPYTFKSADEVEVIAGKFKGVRGKVIRAGRQQRILIELAGFMTFATAYVPTDFIRAI